jgi:hypothetical protein
MSLDLLWTGPLEIAAEGALLRRLMPVFDVPFELLGSSIYSVTRTTAPLGGSPSTMHGTLCTSGPWKSPTAFTL